MFVMHHIAVATV